MFALDPLTVVFLLFILFASYSVFHYLNRNTITEKDVIQCSQIDKEFCQMIMKDQSGTQLHNIAKQINPRAVTFCIINNIPNDTTYSLLMFASHYNNLEAFKLLMERGANQFWRNNFGSSVMTMIAKRGQLEMAELCIKGLTKEEAYILVNIPSNKGWTPLMAAIQNKRICMSNFLLKHGADVNAQMCTGWSPLHVACKMNDYLIKRALKQLRADNSLLANHRIFGKNARPSEVEQDVRQIIIEKEKKISEVESQSAKTIHQEGKKALIAMITITDFKQNENYKHYWSNREGAELDTLLENQFLDNIDCDFMKFDDENKTKNKYLNFVKHVKKKLRGGNYGIVWIIVSSHGGTDERGKSFFVDCEGKRIFVDQDLKDLFAISVFPEMEDKAAIFLINACREDCPDEPGCEIATKQAPSLPAKSYTVMVCQGGQSAVRMPGFGSMALILLGRSLVELKASVSCQELIKYTQNSKLSKTEGKFKDDNNTVIFQRFEIVDSILEDIIFKNKSH